MPGNAVPGLRENLDFDLEIREGTPMHADDLSNRIVTPCDVLVGVNRLMLTAF